MKIILFKDYTFDMINLETPSLRLVRARPQAKRDFNVWECRTTLEVFFVYGFGSPSHTFKSKPYSENPFKIWCNLMKQFLEKKNVNEVFYSNIFACNESKHWLVRPESVEICLTIINPSIHPSIHHAMSLAG
jgi:hypothetical protein